LITAAGKEVVVMTRGTGGIGGLPFWHDNEKKSTRLQLTRKEARFNPVMKDLWPADVYFVYNSNYCAQFPRKEVKKYSARSTPRKAVQQYGNW
jgi:hypothetical protein